ncbi:hypothetical protein QAD02_001369 [Eretmocerus hayati]|uniref:Uncharacterized protein n=1 Tax=Eretmocerus hayati TaxID=131215 RepID=A0ACC2NKM4_9HYME|nr:hypothetical protein QAD02_001369 [Eretmocerus hayati]
MRQFMQIPSALLLFYIFSMANGKVMEKTYEPFTRELVIPSGSKLSMLGNSVTVEGFYPYMTCNFQNTSKTDCTLFRLHPLGRDEKNSFTYESSEDRMVTEIIDLKFNSNGFYLLVQEYSIKDPSSLFVSGIAFDFSNGKTSKLALPFDISFIGGYVGAIVNSGKLEILVTNNPKCCIGSCKLTFDMQGQLVGEPVPYPINYCQIMTLPKQLESKDQGIFTYGVTDFTTSSWQVAHMNSSGEPTIVFKFERVKDLSLVSNTRDLYGICVKYEEKSKLECLQYAWQNNVTSVAQLNVEKILNESSDSKIVSFANGGNSTYLFVVMESKNDIKRGIKINKVDSHENLLKSTPIFSDLECNDHFPTKSVITQIGDDFCSYFTCFVKNSTGAFPRLHIKYTPMKDL